MLNWGAVVVGGVSGLGAGILLAIPFLATGLADTDELSGQAVLILVGFAAQVIAGYVAARFSGVAQAAHGSIAALGLFGVVAAISIATGSDPAIATLLFSGVVAMVLGSAGGVLAAGTADRRERRSED